MAVLKVNNLKVNTKVCANSSRTRNAIQSRDTAIRICSVPKLNRENQFVKIPSWDKVMGLAEYFCLPFQQAVPPIMAIS
jgi:hypothetical protein